MRAATASRGSTLPAGRYLTKPADGLLDVVGINAHGGSPTSSGRTLDGLYGNPAYSYPESWVPLIAAAGIRWIRHDIQPGNGTGGGFDGQGSLSSYLWTSGGGVSSAAAANDAHMWALYGEYGLKGMLTVNDSRGLGQLQSYAGSGGAFSQAGWWPGIIESMNEDYNFLAHPYGNVVYPKGTTAPAWVSGHAYSVGDVCQGAQSGTSNSENKWYCIQAHTSSTGNETPDASPCLMSAPHAYWVPLWAWTQIHLNQQNVALRNSTAGLANTIVADGGSANDGYLPTLIYTSESLGLGNGLGGVDMFNIHNYGGGNYSWGAVQAEINLPNVSPIGPFATTKGSVILGETGITCTDTDFGSGNNMLSAWCEGYRLGMFKVFGYHIMDDIGSYPTTIPNMGADYGILTPTPGTTVPWTGSVSAFPIIQKPGYTMIKNLLTAIADVGAQLPNRTVDFHFTGTSPAPPVVMQRRNGQIDIPVYKTPTYTDINSPADADSSCTINLDNGFTASKFQLLDPVSNTWTSSSVSAGQTSWALNPGINKYPRLLRITPG